MARNLRKNDDIYAVPDVADIVPTQQNNTPITINDPTNDLLPKNVQKNGVGGLANNTTKTKAANAAQRDLWSAGIDESVSKMLSDPTFLSLSKEQQNQQIDGWYQGKFKPYINSIAGQYSNAATVDEDIYTRLEDFKATQAKDDKVGTLGATYNSAYASVSSMGNYMWNGYFANSASDDLVENKNKQLSNNVYLESLPDTPENQEERGRLINENEKLESEATALRSKLAKNAKEFTDWSTQLAKEHPTSTATMDEVNELSQGEAYKDSTFKGLSAAWDSGNTFSYLLDNTMTGIGSMVPGAIAGGVAGLVTKNPAIAGRLFMVGAAGGGAGLSLDSQIKAIMDTPEDVMQQYPKYRELLNAGMAPEEARATIATSAGKDQFVASFLINAAAMPLGGAAGSIGKGIAAGGIAVKAPVMKGLAKAVAYNVGIDVGTAVAETASQNIIRGISTGDNSSRWYDNMGDAIALGAISSGILNTAIHLPGARKAARADKAKATAQDETIMGVKETAPTTEDTNAPNQTATETATATAPVQDANSTTTNTSEFGPVQPPEILTYNANKQLTAKTAEIHSKLFNKETVTPEDVIELSNYISDATDMVGDADTIALAKYVVDDATKYMADMVRPVDPDTPTPQRITDEVGPIDFNNTSGEVRQALIKARRDLGDAYTGDVSSAHRSVDDTMRTVSQEARQSAKEAKGKGTLSPDSLTALRDSLLALYAYDPDGVTVYKDYINNKIGKRIGTPDLFERTMQNVDGIINASTKEAEAFIGSNWAMFNDLAKKVDEQFKGVGNEEPIQTNNIKGLARRDNTRNGESIAGRADLNSEMETDPTRGSAEAVRSSMEAHVVDDTAIESSRTGRGESETANANGRNPENAQGLGDNAERTRGISRRHTQEPNTAERVAQNLLERVAKRTERKRTESSGSAGNVSASETLGNISSDVMPTHQVGRKPDSMNVNSITDPVHEDAFLSPFTGEQIEHMTPNGHDLVAVEQGVNDIINGAGVPDHVSTQAKIIQSMLASYNRARSAAKKAQLLLDIDYAIDSLNTVGVTRFARERVSPQMVTKINRVMKKITPEQRATLQEAYNNSGFSNPHEFLVQMSIESTTGKEGYLSRAYQSLSKTARNVIRQIKHFIIAGVAILGLHEAGVTPINDAMAAHGGASYTLANAQYDNRVSNAANHVNQFVKQYNDNRSSNYVIVDKANGKMYVYNKDHTLINESNVIVGKERGDTPNVGNTPSGAFTIQHVETPGRYGGDVMGFAASEQGGVFAIHRLANKAGEDRAAALVSDDINDRRMSDGCINVPEDFYNKTLKENSIGRVYVIPETQSVQSVFPLYEKGVPTTMTGTLGATDSMQAINNVLSDLSPDDLAYINATNPSLFESGVAPEQSNALKGAFGVLMGRAARHADMQAAKDTTIANGTYVASKDPLRNMLPESDLPVLFHDDDGARNHILGTDRTKSHTNYLEGDKFQTLLHNAGIRFTNDFVGSVKKFLASSYQKYGTQDHNLVHSAAKVANMITNSISQINTTILRPLHKSINMAAKKYKVDHATMTHIVGSVATLRHIEEANRALSAEKRAEYGQLVEQSRQVNDPTILQTDYAKSLAKWLYDFDESQKQGKIIGNASMAGGLTDIQARDALNWIYDKFPQMDKTELHALAQTVSDSYEAMVQRRLAKGMITQAMYDGYKERGFKHYVALYKNADDTIYNPVIELHREGASTTTAGNAMSNLYRQAYRVAKAEGNRDFAFEVGKLYDTMNDPNNPHENRSVITRIDLDDPRVKMTEDQSLSPGIYETKTFNGVQRRYKYIFDNEDMNKQLRYQSSDEGGLSKFIRKSTAMYSKSVTVMVPMFGPVTMGKDLVERIGSAFTMTFRNDDGTTVSGTRIATQLLNPIRNTAIFKDTLTALWRDDHNTTYGKYLKELRDDGGFTTYMDLLRIDPKNLTQTVKNIQDPHTIWKQADHILTKYNEVYQALAPVAMYTALREAGIDPKRASGYTLDQLNFSGRGSFSKKLNIVEPFSAASFLSLGLLGKSLGIEPGVAFNSAAAWKSRAKFGAATIGMSLLYAMAREMAGQDEDGNYKLDMLPLNSLGKNIPLYLGGNDYFKVTMGFGTTQLMATMGAGLDRLVRGKADVGDLGLATRDIIMENGLLPTAPGFDFTSDPIAYLALSLTPSTIKPIAYAGFNKNYFGGTVYNPNGVRKSTPSLYDEMASSIPFVKLRPEQLQTIIEGYMIGPLAAVPATIKDNSQYVGKTKSQHFFSGVTGSLLGANRLFGNDESALSNQFYSTSHNMMSALDKAGVEVPSNGQISANKFPEVKKQMRLNGFNETQVRDVRQFSAYSTKISALNRSFKDKLQKLKKRNASADDIQDFYNQYESYVKTAQRELLRNMNGEW